MTATSTTGPQPAEPSAGAPPLFAGLLDDAAIFPPRNAPVAEALAGYRRSTRSAAGPYVGSFLCSAPRLGELLAALDEDARLDLGLVVPRGVEDLSSALDAVAADGRLRLRAVELPAGDAGVARTLDALDALLEEQLPAYVEVPLDADVAAAAEVVRRSGRRMKMRTGGTVASAFPTSSRLAAGLVACARTGVPFKLTAGLHHAVRHRDSVTGFEHHGFLNVLAAVAGALGGGRVREVADLLEQRDAAALARTAATLPPGGATRVRELFTGFGTCSTDEPLGDLSSLGLIRRLPA